MASRGAKSQDGNEATESLLSDVRQAFDVHHGVTFPYSLIHSTNTGDTFANSPRRLR